MRGFLRQVELPVPVISVGNITLGGTGKTPFVIALAKFLKGKGLKVCVLSRGYRRKGKKELLVCDGQRLLASPEESGDEPYLIATKTKAIVAVGKDRAKAFDLAKHLQPEIVVLDDGFQHIRIKRDLDICLVDGSRGFGNGMLFPAGPLREPVETLLHADAIVITKRKSLQLLYKAKGILSKKPVFFFTPKVKAPKVDKAFLVTAIANPYPLLEELSRMGITLTGYRFFPDHHWFKEKDLAGIEAPILTTEKDLVKFPEPARKISLAVELEEELPPSLKAFVEERLCL